MPRSLPPVTLTSLLLCACATSDPTADELRAERVREYRERFAAAAGEQFTSTVPRVEFCELAGRTKVLWLGDHHAHSRLHALQSELLVDLAQRGVPLALGLEAIGIDDQADVDAYLASTIELAELRSRMRKRWKDSWLDDRELDPWYYRGLLLFAQQHKLPVFALEPTPRLPLAERDATIARSVAAAAERMPDRVLAVIVGQSHLLGSGDVVARSGLPGVVVGGLPTEQLAAIAPDRPTRRELWQTDAGTWWFAEMLGPTGAGVPVSR